MGGTALGTVQIVSMAGFEVELTRKRVRNINLRVRSDGSVCVSAAPRVSLKRIEAFVNEKRSWIESAQWRAAGQQEAQMAHCVDGATVRIWGRPHTCCIEGVASRGARPSCRFSTGEGVLCVEADDRVAGEDEVSVATRDTALKSFLRAELKAAASAALPDAESIVGKRASSLRFREMKSRWGSCNVRTGAITLNTRLVHFSPRCLEYVLIHELCHLHEPSHNEHFHALMDRFYPSWREVRNELNGMGWE